MYTQRNELSAKKVAANFFVRKFVVQDEFSNIVTSIITQARTNNIERFKHRCDVAYSQHTNSIKCAIQIGTGFAGGERIQPVCDL